MRVRFGDCVFDSETRELVRAERPVRVPPRAFQLLEVLIERRPEAIAKDDLHRSPLAEDLRRGHDADGARQGPARGDRRRRPNAPVHPNGLRLRLRLLRGRAPGAPVSPGRVLLSGDRSRVPGGSPSRERTSSGAGPTPSSGSTTTRFPGATPGSGSRRKARCSRTSAAEMVPSWEIAGSMLPPCFATEIGSGSAASRCGFERPGLRRRHAAQDPGEKAHERTEERPERDAAARLAPRTLRDRVASSARGEWARCIGRGTRGSRATWPQDPDRTGR